MNFAHVLFVNWYVIVLRSAKHWVEHKVLCNAIKNLSMPTSTLPGLGDSVDTNVFVSSPKQRNTVA